MADVLFDYGTLKWFNVSKAYGFIRGEDGEEVFTHATSAWARPA
jgi:cold shock CspA family protein